MDSLNLNYLRDVIDSLIPEFDNKDIDDFVARGNKIEDIVFVTCVDAMKDVNKLKTKHGILEVQYNRFLAPNANFLMKRV